MKRPGFSLPLSPRPMIALGGLVIVSVAMGFTLAIRFGAPLIQTAACSPTEAPQYAGDPPRPSEGLLAAAISQPGASGWPGVDAPKHAESKQPAPAATKPTEQKAPAVATAQKSAPAIAATDSAQDEEEASQDEPKVSGSPKTAPSRQPAKVSRGTYTAQIAALPSLEKAEERVEKLKSMGFKDAFTEAARLNGGKDTWYRVCIGKFPDPGSAQKEANRLVAKGQIQNFIVRRLSSSEPHE